MPQQDHEEQNQASFMNWPFSKLFHGFRYAIAPGKTILAVAALSLVFLTGHLLDAIWPDSYRVVTAATGDSYVHNELDYYASLPAFEENSAQLDSYRTTTSLTNRQMLARALQAQFRLSPKEAQDLIDNDAARARIKTEYEKNLMPAGKFLRHRYKIQSAAIKNRLQQSDQLPTSKEAFLREQKDLDKAYAQTTSAMAHGLTSFAGGMDVLFTPNPAAPTDTSIQQGRDQVFQVIQLATLLNNSRATRGHGPFKTLYQFNVRQFHNIIRSVLAGEPAAIWGSLKDIAQSWFWLARYHWVFAIIFVLASLAIWAIFGGAICRIAALQFARDERIGPTRALAFSLKKFGSFFAAPLIPLMIIGLVVALILLGGLLGSIPFAGEILAGILLGLTFVGGFVIALVLIGWGVGVHLMYPTIAVEGSDSFDAISRSFAYIFARPWRLAFYTIISWVYGAICYLFVRFFAFLLLWVTHAGLGAIINLFPAHYAADGKLNAMWPEPTFWELRPTINWQILNWSEATGAFFIYLWVILIIAVVMAFVINYYFSLNTVIYFLLRRRVDATDLEDIYVEQDINQLGTPPPAPETTPAPGATPLPEEKKDDPTPPS